ncbi:amino acid permease [uncultured Draconibacterium sp.]|uniref:amino acid permease n=1 Tax=uncultured Draconibacterium sp. TaxID=1573823 RepID=UPI00325FF321
MKLKKELGLFDVFAISTGAMFSSGFFLLPGIASQYTGPSVILAYFLAGILIMPTMFSIAEIATALPRAGGTYYFLDRSLGPMFGTIGGIGKYIALSLKTAFALVGIGAYTSIFWDIPIKETAVFFAFVFTIINIFGAKKSSGIQKVFVIILLVTIGLFIAEGLRAIIFSSSAEPLQIADNFDTFFTHGTKGLIFTTGFVFVSYLGLTQIASVAEEIKRPERNIPLGMALSLAVIMFIYVAGVYIIVAVVDKNTLANDLSPVATAAEQLFNWLPAKIGLYLIIVSAILAFASTGNAGMLSTSRYPLAMSRDKLFSSYFKSISRFGTPIPSIILTAILIILFILFLTEEGIVKLASTFQLIIFIAINFSVIVFRNSKIASYDPGYHSPLYPFMQIFGILTSLALMFFMGVWPVVFTLFTIFITYLWYRFYVRQRVKREGAIFHWFALLGKHQHDELENEFMTILREKGLREDDQFNQMLVRAKISRYTQTAHFDEVIETVSKSFAQRLNIAEENLRKEFTNTSPIDSLLTVQGVSFHYMIHQNIDTPMLHIVLAEQEITKTVRKNNDEEQEAINVFFFLVHSDQKPKLQLRILSGILDLAERDYFIKDMLSFKTEQELIEYLLHDKQYISFSLKKENESSSFIDKKLMDITLPNNVLVVFIERGSEVFAPKGKTILKENDILTIIGETNSINTLYDRYILKQ